MDKDMDKQEYEIVLTVQSKKGKKPEIWLDDNFDVRGVV